MKKIAAIIIIGAFLLLAIAGLVLYTTITLILLTACSLAGLVLFKIAPLKKSKNARIRPIGPTSSKRKDQLTA
jgi:hypothetical protein